MWPRKRIEKEMKIALKINWKKPENDLRIENENKSPNRKGKYMSKYKRQIKG